MNIITHRNALGVDPYCASVMTPPKTSSINLYSLGVRVNHCVWPLSVDSLTRSVCIESTGNGHAIIISALRFTFLVVMVVSFSRLGSQSRPASR